MKIYNKITFEWRNGEYVKTAEDSYEYTGPVAEAKGGGGGAAENYANLDRLYGIQADQAETLGNYAKNTVLPAYKGFLDEAKGYGSQANQEFEATNAGKTADDATTSASANMADNMASMGVNPSDPRYQSALSDIQTRGAASKAASMTGTRAGIRKEGFARTQDAVSLGMGTPTQATAAANSAANAAYQSGSLQANAQNAQTQGIGNAVRGGFNLYNSFNTPTGAADGGQVLRLKGGGYVQHFATGGGVLGGKGITTPPPPMMRTATSPVQEAVGAGLQGTTAIGGGSLAKGIGMGAEKLGSATGMPQVEAFGQGMQTSQPGIKEYASKLVDKALGKSAPAPQASGSLDAMAADRAEEMGSHAAEQAALDPAAEAATVDSVGSVGTEAATDLAATAGAEGLGEVAAQAIPVVGQAAAVYGIGKAVGWWADGGNVQPGSVGQTGPISGPGGPKDDLIPAMLSNGEFVMPVGVVKKFGLDKLEKMRQQGLEFEKQLGIQRRRQNG